MRSLLLAATCIGSAAVGGFLPPSPEPITVTRLRLPPVALNTDNGSCTPEINPRRTGCVSKTSDLHSGHYLRDGVHLLAIANFTGAPVEPDPASIYQGQQLILIKTDNTTFPNGDSWKCITCGVSSENSQGRGLAMDYPQAFVDGKRALAGTNVVECSDGLASEACGPDSVRIIPLRWNTATNNSGPGGSMRELRLHPDNHHIGFNSIHVTSNGIAQSAFFGRLRYDPSPKWGQPPAPRYDVINVSLLYNEEQSHRIIVSPDDPSHLIIQPGALAVGELRGFGGTGKEVTWLGAPVESCNIDVFASDITTGKVRRLTSHPEYVDPVDLSPDDKWSVVLDTRGAGRQMFIAGLRGIPPLIDLVAVSAVSSVRNNGKRRFFQPWLIDQYGDRDHYYGQQVNAEGSGIPGSGSINDPEWNARADPRWSWDGTRIAYTQIITEEPACGGVNPLPCYNSTEDGGRNERIMIAHLTSHYGMNVLVGSESVSRENPTPFVEVLHWYSDLTQTGPNNGTKITSPDGFHLSIDIDLNFFEANGTLTTTVAGKEYHQPANYT
ncbi:hypothetical protein G7Z17_g2733 [Cylindrodendrum hubeiense]|uniref:Saponin hydrolase n=1 Tax=Cylindrodendrum hubeiense TaxID=595255 RepID=A0A9P5HI80_9HYPO|nr:hypothetical protein G7Z17_g2733 [Cylindrodendrum hubeiense]